MSLATERNTPARSGDTLALGVASGKKLFAGALACLSLTGFTTPGALATGLLGLGRVKSTVDNSAGADGDLVAEVERGVFGYANSAGGDAISNADIDRDCFVVDDQTVARTDGGATRSKAGKVAFVDANNVVWVDFRAPKAGGKVYLHVAAADLVAADAAVYGITSPIAGRITNIFSSLEGHILVAGDATLTGKIGAAAITGGVLTISLAGTVIGDQDSVQPTAANVVVPGSRINFTVGGANTNAVARAELVIEITP